MTTAKNHGNEQDHERREEETVSTTTEPDRLWSIHDVSALLCIPVQTLYYWRYQGIGPKAYRCGRHLRYDPAEVRRWLTEEAA